LTTALLLLLFTAGDCFKSRKITEQRAAVTALQCSQGRSMLFTVLLPGVTACAVVKESRIIPVQLQSTFNLIGTVHQFVSCRVIEHGLYGMFHPVITFTGTVAFAAYSYCLVVLAIIYVCEIRNVPRVPTFCYYFAMWIPNEMKIS
jgi:hypothetical protein